MTRLEKLEYIKQKGFTYAPETGKIYSNRNKEITWNDGSGYIRIAFYINKKQYKVMGHQFAWFFINGTVVQTLDHINRIKDDNRIINLRSSNYSEQNKNRSKYTWKK